MGSIVVRQSNVAHDRSVRSTRVNNGICDKISCIADLKAAVRQAALLCRLVDQVSADTDIACREVDLSKFDGFSISPRRERCQAKACHL